MITVAKTTTPAETFTDAVGDPTNEFTAMFGAVELEEAPARNGKYTGEIPPEAVALIRAGLDKDAFVKVPLTEADPFAARYAMFTAAAKSIGYSIAGKPWNAKSGAAKVMHKEADHGPATHLRFRVGAKRGAKSAAISSTTDAK